MGQALWQSLSALGGTSADPVDGTNEGLRQWSLEMHSAGYEQSALPSAHAFLSLAADALDAHVGKPWGHRGALYSDAEFHLVMRSVRAHMA